ncbi:Acyl-CoA 6-aminopenicillanic-acid-acyltransferase [Aspergillus sclerotialis]|uniref:Acyl-CoA 6-aminopenicillanic-acid-acyltransferase n=1 Tax=Aspergillus sclerotialis TaxID=2070753 RepID=A0A3A2ZG67_9EURO|nr:Acyl-CoA 6-aminopenicillanic-acid-acyltransferase [Aspergillus sclerotialis]
MSWASVLALANEFQATLAKLTPDIYEEMQGIAEGAGFGILDIVALNCRSEIALGRFSDGCTSISWKKNENSRVLAQNWDWTRMVGENLAAVSIEKAGKPRIYMVTEAGIVGKIGFNTAGVGTGLNAIRAKDGSNSKLPIHVALRVCLESTSVENALQTLASCGGVASAQHILIADPTISLGLELSPVGDVHLKEDEFGMITHSNHFLENRYVDENPFKPGTYLRLERIRELAQNLAKDGVKGEKITPTLLREKLFTDSRNAPYAICALGDPNLHRTVRSCSLFNIVMNLSMPNPSAEVVLVHPEGRMGDSVMKMPWV